MNRKIKIIRATTVPGSLNNFCRGMLRELSEKYEVVGVSSPGKELDEVAEREGVRVIAVPMERHISLVRDWKSLVAMVRVFRKERPTMVHSMTPKAGMICMVAAWMTRVPVRVHTFTGLVWPTATGLKRRILMATDWLTCACATHVIPEGEGVKNDLISGGITKKPMKVLGYGNVRGVDMTYYSRRPEVMARVEQIMGRTAQNQNKNSEENSNKIMTFLFVGRIVRDKGINELVEAFDRLSQEVAARLVLVGRYEEALDPISQRAKGIISQNERIEAVGPKRGDELLAYYAAADCFVLPSYREGFPNTVLEAGAMGLPCVVTDINGSREIIQEGVNGMIVRSKDSEALYHAMKVMAQSRADRERMAGNARRMMAERFEQGYVRRCLYEFYEEILAM